MPRAIWRRTSSAAGLADRCTIQIAYAIGVAKPLSIYVDTHGTGTVDEEQAGEAAAASWWICRRAASARISDLNRPIYARTAAYGHFGRAPEPDGGFSWERLDLVDGAAVARCTEPGVRLGRSAAIAA